jgi:uncharacterized coiled-coil DUF342 family protein
MGVFDLIGKVNDAMEHFDPDEMKAQIQTVVNNVADMHLRMVRIEEKLDQIMTIRNRTNAEVVKSVKAIAEARP